MLIMLDGANGVGKSTYAYRMKERFGIPVCRVFRSGNKELHWGSTDKELQDELAKLKVPINTHIDDLFMADFMLTFQVDAILDRTLASAIAYGRTYNKMDGWYHEKGNARRLLDFWVGLISRCSQPAFYVWLDAPYGVAKERCDGRWCPNKKEYDRLRREYERVFSRLPFKKIRLDTTLHGVDKGINRIADAVR